VILGVVLAGGLARRLGGIDKARVALGGETLLARAAARLGPQCPAGLVVSANGDPARFATPLPVLPDPLPDHPGPLAGLLAALDFAAAHPEIELVLTSAVDVPFVPLDLAGRLAAARDAAGAAVACAASAGRAHPVQALWPVSLRDDLRRALLAGERRVGGYAARHGCAQAAWSAAPDDPFHNVNTSADLAAAERRLSRG
jgi:molybdenum cofactor guanylyltransferase